MSLVPSPEPPLQLRELEPDSVGSRLRFRAPGAYRHRLVVETADMLEGGPWEPILPALEDGEDGDLAVEIPRSPGRSMEFLRVWTLP